jgi:hypothetical protein
MAINHKGTKSQSKGAILCVFVSLWLMGAAEHRDVGLTQKGNRIEAAVVLGPTPTSPMVLLIGGLTANDASSRVVNQEIQSLEAIPQNQRPFQLLAIPVANPDAAKLQFPPTGVAYRENSDSHAL